MATRSGGGSLVASNKVAPAPTTDAEMPVAEEPVAVSGAADSDAAGPKSAW